ncbi:cytochrome c [uncultured Algoriphagus sp.]|uniref:c-type cytochrome n=1 Tax=uncultured Algoriphagus sp. TaxID=417365 RepID=UPI0030EDE710
MKNRMLYITTGLFIALVILQVRCATPQYVIEKSGAQLWGESCVRCHNTASPSTFSDVQWDVAVKHMEFRAQLTREEAEKIVEFLKSAN